MAPLLPPAMAPRVPAPLLSVSESGRRRRPSARSRRLLLSTSAGAILARQEPGAPRGRRQATPAPATRGERPGGASGGASPGDTPSPSPPPPPRRRRARYPEGVAKHWNRLPRQEVGSLSLEVTAVFSVLKE
ncbi:translation initiation factor IF-2-like [Corvus cornix cornix]|uniref:translation initiation factor IF-2-like n=1 Tax=Corvus cornix cornix TaxID=932674 RepID=UPI00194E60C0|nr:translation initiation factor IF-2-like [Corvus cornix cornix]